MIIGGLQKLSLVDYPGKICSVVFTQGCVFRCSYCHNPDLVLGPCKLQIPEQTVLDYLSNHRSMLEGVVVTGGEPTLHKDLRDFLHKIKKLGLLVKLDSNGINPEILQGFIDDRLVDYIAMDIKAPWEKYDRVMQTSKTIGPTKCKQTLEVIQNSGVAHEFRTTVFPGVHTEEDFVEMASYLKPLEHYYVQNIRYQVTLDPKIRQDVSLDVSGIVERLKKRYPRLAISER